MSRYQCPDCGCTKPPVTANQKAIMPLYASGLTYKEIARRVGRTPDGVRRVVRNLRERGGLPERQRHQWPVPRP